MGSGPLFTFWTSNCSVGRGFSPIFNKNALTPAGCPSFNSTQFNWLLTPLTQRKHQVLQVKGSVLKDCSHRPHTSYVRYKPRFLPVLLTDWLRLKGSHDPLQSEMPISSPSWYQYLWSTGSYPWAGATHTSPGWNSFVPSLFIWPTPYLFFRVQLKVTFLFWKTSSFPLTRLGTHAMCSCSVIAHVFSHYSMFECMSSPEDRVLCGQRLSMLFIIPFLCFKHSREGLNKYFLHEVYWEK